MEVSTPTEASGTPQQSSQALKGTATDTVLEKNVPIEQQSQATQESNLSSVSQLNHKSLDSNNIPTSDDSLNRGTTSEQMIRIFEQEIEKYNIATYVCELHNYFSSKEFHISDCNDFIESIQNHIMVKFVSHQNEDVYKDICEFNETIYSYMNFLVVAQSSPYKKYVFEMLLNAPLCEVIEQIDDDRKRVESNLNNKKQEVNAPDGASIKDLESQLISLTFITSALMSHKKLCELYYKITSGKSLLVY